MKVDYYEIIERTLRDNVLAQRLPDNLTTSKERMYYVDNQVHHQMEGISVGVFAGRRIITDPSYSSAPVPVSWIGLFHGMGQLSGIMQDKIDALGPQQGLADFYDMVMAS